VGLVGIPDRRNIVQKCAFSDLLVFLLFLVLFLLKASATVAIPKEHHRFVIGKNGEKLQDLELKTATKIQIPRPDDPSNQIKITGTKEGIEKARHEVLLISAEQVGPLRVPPSADLPPL
jgi:predicted PilT family ATPase